jgi:hypothetical protein
MADGSVRDPHSAMRMIRQVPLTSPISMSPGRRLGAAARSFTLWEPAAMPCLIGGTSELGAGTAAQPLSG